MKRVLFPLAGLGLTLTVIAASLPFLVSTEKVQSSIRDQLQLLTGHEVRFAGEPKVLLNPFLSFEINELDLVNPSEGENEAPLLQVEMVQAKPNLLRSLFGNLMFDEFVLLRPRLNLRTGVDGKTNWQFRNGTIGRIIESARSSGSQASSVIVEDNPVLGKFVIVDGAVRHEQITDGEVRQITAVDGVLNWPDLHDSLKVEGTAIWQGENFRYSGELDEPLQLGTGGTTNTRLDIESVPFNMRFDGTSNRLNNLFFKGEVNFSTPSTRRFSELLGTRIGNFGKLELEGSLEATAQTIRLTDASVDIAGNPSQGFLNLGMNEDGVSKLSGTLAFDELDFSRFLAASSEEGTGSEFRDTAVKSAIDLRISARTVNAGFVELTDIAAIATADPGGWTVDVGQSIGFGGNLIAKFGERYEGDTRLAYLEANGASVDTAEISALFKEHRIRFSGLANLSLSMRGKNIVEVLNRTHINGKLEASFINGAIEGIDLPNLLADIRKEPNNPQTGTDLGSRTQFTNATATVHVTDSIGTIGQSEIQTNNGRVRISGSIGFQQGSLSLRAQELDDDGPQPERLFIGGTFRTPLVSLKPVQKTLNISPAPSQITPSGG